MSEFAAIEIWRQQLRNEAEAAEAWKANWGFIANKKYPPPRGFSTMPVKYTAKAGTWTNSRIRVPDSSKEGTESAMAEEKARQELSKIDWKTNPVLGVKPCETKGIKVVTDSREGVPNRTAAKLMLAHKLQALGDACLTDGMSPNQKYSAPQTSSQEVGWYAPSANKPSRGVELFGTGEYARKNMRKSLYDMVP